MLTAEDNERLTRVGPGTPKGLILYRQMLMDNLDKAERGEDPMNVFRAPAAEGCIKLPTEESAGSSRRWAGGDHSRLPSSAGAARGATPVTAAEVIDQT